MQARRLVGRWEVQENNMGGSNRGWAQARAAPSPARGICVCMWGGGGGGGAEPQKLCKIAYPSGL